MLSDVTNRGESLPSDNFKEQLENFYEYTLKSKSDSSRRTYSFAWTKFLSWCNENGYSIGVQPTELLVGLFLTQMAKDRTLKPSSINTYLAGIKHFLLEKHQIELDHPEIRKAMKGIRVDMRDIKKTKKSALLVDHLKAIIEPMQDSSDISDIRDKALILIGFCGAFRRSELVGIKVEHIEFDLEGITITIPWSKTDQEGKGQQIQISTGKYPTTCPVTALKNWLEVSEIDSGPVFRAIDRHGNIKSKKMSDKAVSLILKIRASGLFNENTISGHSLRRGLVTSAIQSEVAETIIMRQTRHKSTNTLKEYYDEQKDYRNNVTSKLDL